MQEQYGESKSATPTGRGDWCGPRRQRFWGLLGATLAGDLLVFEIVRGLA